MASVPKPPSKRNPYRILDLFSGIGGFTLGLERAGMKTVAFCEKDPFCQAVLTKHWPNIPLYADIQTLTHKRLVIDGILPIDLVCGGFPCQDITIAGKRVGINGTHSSLWKELRRIIGEIRPRYALVENVANLLSGDHGRWMGTVLGDLAEIGFDAQWHCLPAAAIGAPHYRDRVFIIAYPNCSRLPRHHWPIAQPADLVRCAWWETEPCVGRMAHGLPHQSHRLRALGNAVVPELVYRIGCALVRMDRHLHPHEHQGNSDERKTDDHRNSNTL